MLAVVQFHDLGRDVRLQGLYGEVLCEQALFKWLEEGGVGRSVCPAWFLMADRSPHGGGRGAHGTWEEGTWGEGRVLTL